MTLPPQLAQQCLEALEHAVHFRLTGEGRPPEQTCADAIAALREALASGEGDEARDAARYRWLRDTLHGAVGGGIEVNDDRLVYQEAEPGEEVRVFWYPVTPVGFYAIKASTLDEAVDVAMKGNGK